MEAIYFALFDSCMNYADLIWVIIYLRFINLQKKALRIVNNYPRNSSLGPLFKKSNILNFEDKILISNAIFISKSINHLLPPIFKNWFISCSDIYNYDSASSSTHKLFKLSKRTDPYAWNSIIVNATHSWNKIQNMFGVSHLNFFIQPN